MMCVKCGTEMFLANMSGNGLYPLLLTNKKKGVFESEKRTQVSCYVCSACGYIELYAENPNEIKLD